MMPILALLAPIWLGLSRPHPPETHRYSIGAWRLAVSSDTFTGRRSCALSRRVGLRLVNANAETVDLPISAIVDPEGVWVRIDDQQAKLWSDFRKDALNVSAPAFAERLDGSRADVLRLPTGALRSASVVRIRIAEGRKPVAFAIDRLDEALAAAHAQGCLTNAAQARPTEAGR